MGEVGCRSAWAVRAGTVKKNHVRPALRTSAKERAGREEGQKLILKAN